MFNIWIRVFTYWFMMYVKDWRHNSAKLIGRRVRAVCGWIDVWLFMSLFIYLLSIIQFLSFGVICFNIYSHIYWQVRAIYMWVNRRQTLHVATGLSNIHCVFFFIHLFIYIFARYLYVGESTSNSSCCHLFMKYSFLFCFCIHLYICALSICRWIDIKLFMLLFIFLTPIYFFG